MLSPASLPTTLTRGAAELPQLLRGREDASFEKIEEARELKEAFTQFVGETFFGQMLQTMRQSVGEPAYFHGGMAERQFQARLDQQVAQDMAASGGGAFANGLFESQFPREAALLENAKHGEPGLTSLDSLRRR